MRKILTLFFVLHIAGFCFAQVKVQYLLTENTVDPISIDAINPRLSWQLNAGDKRGVMQTAYELKVSSAKDKHEVWKTGKVMSDQSMYIIYKGEPLAAGQKYIWQVRIWDNAGKASAWSEPASWRMGLLTAADWKAQWITPAGKEDSINRPSPLLRKQFSLTKKVKSAFAYITAHGLYEAQINGRRVGDAYLTPGWTSYNKRLQYQVYDVTNMLQPGANAVGATLGSGWYRGHIGFPSVGNKYGKDISLLFQLEVTYTDGTTATIISDDTWKTSTGAVRFAEIYYGAVIDDRKEQKAWSTANFDDKKWTAVNVNNFNKDVLVATINEPIRKHETFKPIKIFKTPKGEQVIDFGQNLVGWIQMKVNGHAGDTVKISHAEVIDKLGNFYTENLRSARAENVFVLKGDGKETFEPQFTWQGFRFIKVVGYPGELKPEDFTAITLYSDMKPEGTFSCSNPMLNQLQHNIQWGQKGNFLDVPTDCPQRDERLGWTGDAQVFSRTASYNMNVHNFFTKWMKDVAADQFSSGSVPFVIPNVIGAGEQGGSTGWSDVSTIIPWNIYLAYGDKQILENQYASMKAWVKFMENKSRNDLWNTGDHFGDWLFYSVNDDTDGTSAITSKYLIAQCFYAYSTQLMINTAQVLGKKDDEAYYTDLLARIKKAFVNEYVTPNGLISSDTQTAYVLALQFDMLPENLRAQAAVRLVDNIHRYRNHLTTGFLGTPYLCHVLSRFGHADVAYQLLLQDTYPSWLYPVKMGATTIWERWDGIRTDGTFETPTMNSYNHYAYGAIGDWMYRVVAGIDTKTDAPGYKEITIKPTIGGNLQNASADYETNYGKVSSHWKIDGANFLLDVEVPANTTATVYIPGTSSSSITEGGKAMASVPGIKAGDAADGYVAVNVGSGVYHFVTAKP
ncbi:glycoside hydrolase family 78 protein [Mucilaginibacter sp. BJC16-A38]|uniref:glycoside hydrolase family 78 protein n=1 Tax=Mucilaginibacter phenanthrenivorans TaxID=1234842 RepID=UPI0021587B3D|nr:glycoside hydrolase family 78 protein [Mucilaginibacter phenanthrenivorans]MCR8561564.1 glycoside hydrolase family 78 protein [Mucilaginibacter phenanthrenivorans]